MQALRSFQNAIFTLLRGEFSSCHKQLSFFFFIQGPFQMSGPIKHNTTGLWVEKKIQLRGQRRKRTYHAYSCRRKAQWLLSLRIVSSGKKGLSVKRQLKKSKLLTLSTPSTTMSKCQCQRATMAKALCAPMSDFQNPNSIFFFCPFSPRQQIWTEKFSLWSSAQQNGKQTEPSLHWPGPTSAL